MSYLLRYDNNLQFIQLQKQLSPPLVLIKFFNLLRHDNIKRNLIRAPKTSITKKQLNLPKRACSSNATALLNHDNNVFYLLRHDGNV